MCQVNLLIAKQTFLLKQRRKLYFNEINFERSFVMLKYTHFLNISYYNYPTLYSIINFKHGTNITMKLTMS